MTAELIVYALIAAGLVFWLRSILGTRHGEERQRPNPLMAPEKLPAALEGEILSEVKQVTAQEKISNLALHPGPVMSIDNKSAENGLLDIAAADKSFDIKFFLEAAQDAFAMVVEAFAEGDREALKDLLEPSVYEPFEAAIVVRENKGETQRTEIHSVQQARVIEAALNGRIAKITVRFKAEETSVTTNKNGDIIEGHPEKITRMVDIWSFSRDVKSKDPRWLVSETRGDFEDDNNLIPDSV